MPKAPTKITAARALSSLDRAMREYLLSRAFGTDQRRRAGEYFQSAGINGCIYCESETFERWDHVVSVYAGGATVLGNMAPACQPCDDSKGAKDYKEWLIGSARRNPAKGNSVLRAKIIQRVQAYQQHFQFVPPADFISALTPEQRAQYSDFTAALAAFRTRVATFGLLPFTKTEEELGEGEPPEPGGD